MYHTVGLFHARYSQYLAFKTCRHTIQYYTTLNLMQLQITHMHLSTLYSIYTNHIHLTQTVFVFYYPHLKINCSQFSSSTSWPKKIFEPLTPYFYINDSGDTKKFPEYVYNISMTGILHYIKWFTSCPTRNSIPSLERTASEGSIAVM